MCRLRFDKKLIHRKPVGVGKDGEVDAEFDNRKKIQGLLGTDRVGVAEKAVGAADLVVERDGLALCKERPGILLMLDDLLDDAVQASNDLLLGLAEGRLVGDLKKITHRLGAFAMETTDGESDFVHGIDDLVDLVAHHKTGQVQHGRRAHAGADIRGACGEVAEVRAEGEFQTLLELGVHAVDHFKNIVELQTATDRLHAEVVLLVDHHAERLWRVHHHGTAHALSGVLATDEMPLDEDLFFQRRKSLEIFGVGLRHLGQMLHGLLDEVHDIQTLGFFCPAREGLVAQVAGQANAA